MSTLIAHEWIEATGGAEAVMDSLTMSFPESLIFTLWNNRQSSKTPSVEIMESWLARSPLRGHKALSLPLMSTTWQNSYLPRVDRVISSSHLFAHHISSNRHLRDVVKYSYIHSPARYIWYPEIDGRLGKLNSIDMITANLKRVDQRMAKFTDHFAANSQFVANRIHNCWDIDQVTVIYPPVDLKKFSTLKSRINSGDTSNVSDRAIKTPSEFLLSAGRLVSYKRVDLTLKLARLLNLPIVIVGDGPDLGKLKLLAKELEANAIFLGKVTDETLAYLYAKALAYVLMGQEDFGIMAVEALASGARILANGVGGYSEIVQNRVSGILCESDDLEIWKSGFDELSRLATPESNPFLEKFSSESFDKNIRFWTESDVL